MKDTNAENSLEHRLSAAAMSLLVKARKAQQELKAYANDLEGSLSAALRPRTDMIFTGEPSQVRPQHHSPTSQPRPVFDESCAFILG